MATTGSCRRLLQFIKKDWSRGLRWLQSTQLTGIQRNFLGGYVFRVPVTSSTIATTKHWHHLSKYSSTTTTTEDHGLDRDSDEEEEVEEPPGFFRRLWRWLHTNDDYLLEYQMSDEERRERDELITKVQEMYFSDPPQEPDLDFCKDAIRMMIKYNDKLGVDCIWGILPEIKIEPDEELTYMVKTFLEECRRKELQE